MKTIVALSSAYEYVDVTKTFLLKDLALMQCTHKYPHFIPIFIQLHMTFEG